MAGTKYSKYIITNYKPDQKKQAWSATYITGERRNPYFIYWGRCVKGCLSMPRQAGFGRL